MKKILFYFICLIFFNSFSTYGSEFKNLFGLKLYVDAGKYFKNSFIKSNKFKNKETHDGFYDIEITDKIVKKNPFLSSYWIVLDEKNSIKQISAEESMPDLNKCINFKNYLIRVFTEKYTFFFIKKEYSHKDFYTHTHLTEVDDNKSLSVTCVDTFSSEKINLIISFESKIYRNRKKEFYESGF